MLPHKKRLLKATVLSIFGALFVFFAAFWFFFDPGAYRAQIAYVLTQKFGRPVEVEGPIHIGFSLAQGLLFSVQDMRISNPEWASRPLFAKVGRAALGVKVRPLWRHHLEVSSLVLEDADIQLERNPGGILNWDLSHTSTLESEKDIPSKSGMNVKVSEVGIERTKFYFKAEDGTPQLFNLTDIMFRSKNQELHVRGNGNVKGKDFVFSVEGQKLNGVGSSDTPFHLVATYGSAVLEGDGVFHSATQIVDMPSYILASGASQVTGALSIRLSGIRPYVSGTLRGQKVILNDFWFLLQAIFGKEVLGDIARKPNSEDANRFFSFEPIYFDKLEMMDADFSAKIDEVAFTYQSVKDFDFRLNLTNGLLTVSPFSFSIAEGKAQGVLKMKNSKTAPSVEAVFNAHHIGIPELASLDGIQSFVIGVGDFDLDLATTGFTWHELAENANGSASLIVGGGTVTGQFMNTVSDKIASLFTGSESDRPSLNCLATRLSLKKGYALLDGFLVDSGQFTFMGTGGFDLGKETIDMRVQTHTKDLDLGSLVPALIVNGGFLSPKFQIDASSSVQKLTEALLGGGIGSDNIPVVITKNGQNACAYTLDHAPRSVHSPSSSSPSAIPSEQARGIGKGILKNLKEMFQ